MEYNNRRTRAGRDGTGRNGTKRDRTNASGDRNEGRYGGKERPTGTSFVIFKFFLLSFSFFFFPVASFLQSTAIGGARWGVTNAGGMAYRSCPHQEVEGGGRVCVRYFLCYILLFFFSHCSYFLIVSLKTITTIIQDQSILEKCIAGGWRY